MEHLAAPRLDASSHLSQRRLDVPERGPGSPRSEHNHPCIICTVEKSSLLQPPFHFRQHIGRASRRKEDSPLLVVAAEWIVPLPLHVYLGISNRILEKVYKRFFPDSFAAATTMVKQIHAPGSGGRSDYHSLNGKELRRWTKQRRVEQLLTPAASPSHPEILPNVPILERWISQLGLLLLSKDEFDRRSFGSLSMLVDEIHQHWTGYTKDTIFPKLHMLYHAISFAEKHGALGKYSEAAMESCHAQLNPIIHHSGRNQGKNTEERLRRALADSATAQMQAVLIERGKLI